MRKIVINPDNLKESYAKQHFHKARVILENNEGKFVITTEGGKPIFPGGKCKPDEPPIFAIQRELQEESGISLKKEDFTPLLELETFYSNFYDYRTDSLRPRHTSTTYFYARCSGDIKHDDMNLTDGEKKEGFDIKFVNLEQLISLLKEDHSSAMNGKFFDEENNIVVTCILQSLLQVRNKTQTVTKQPSAVSSHIEQDR